ncbi:hypothetical protein V8B55DRAFT_1590996 [Mucor lusitanicus]|uniref:F-box domain-containing protein n=2 Tax=Mucor circinelloides f. lusitanicus TaxID=29924 RepID=A0A168GDL1_MUCCL|nr:hypothetical protein FB192DRAFT_1391081 [Mucor lusitanicus]OAC97581.1 hypothetical protein MUCCIDRAFT_86913 [Mucor lusitanicus CBS 277.49]
MLNKKLPQELLDRVFSFIDSARDLAQCRLVCKFLDHPAERAMFSKPIVVRFGLTANALYYHLENKKTMGKLIRSLKFKSSWTSSEPSIYIKLLPLVFTPTMESLQGIIRNPGFFKTLVDIAEATTEATFSNLKVLPTIENKHCSEEYGKALVYFGATLQHVLISGDRSAEIPWQVYSQLSTFDNLTSLEIYNLNTLEGLDTLEGLNRILAPFLHLQELKLLSYGMIEDATDEEDLLEWMNEHVDQVDTLIKVVMEGDEQQGIVEFLVYKYPNMKQADVFLRSFKYYDQEESDTSGIHRIIEALQSVPVYRLYYKDEILPSVMQEIKKHVKSYCLPPFMVSYNNSCPNPLWLMMEVVNDLL